VQKRLMQHYYSITLGIRQDRCELVITHN
jgi:hypothetical protein